MKMKSLIGLLTLFLALIPPPTILAGGYNIEELTDEGVTAPRPFRITRVEPVAGNLRIFITTGNPGSVESLIANGKLLAQLSDNENLTERSVPLYLMKAAHCGSVVVYLRPGDPAPKCAGSTKIEYFLDVEATLGPNLDLAIGKDPEFLWLIEGK